MITPTLKKVFVTGGGSRLPSEYQEVEYLQSSGNQYINTGVSGIVDFEANAQFTQGGAASQILVSTGIASGQWIGQSAGLWIGTRAGYVSSISYTKIIANFSPNLLTATANGVSIGGSHNITSYGTWTLFWRSNFPTYLKLYDCQFSQNGSLVRNFVPCYLKSNSIAGMYDLANSGKNLFAKSLVETGKSLNSSGNIDTRNGWNISEYIEVKSSTKYVTSGSAGAGACRTCFYDADKNFISYDQSGSKVYTTPTNAKYMRLSVQDGSLSTTQLELGSTATTYEPYPFYANSGTGSFIVGPDVSSIVITPCYKTVYVVGGSRLPSAYQEVEYLQSSGTQYIDTSEPFVSNTDELKVDYQLMTNTNWQWIFGNFETSARFGLSKGHGVMYNSTSYDCSDNELMNSKHTFIADNNGVSVDGVNKCAYISFSETKSVYLFAVRNGDVASSFSTTRIYGLEWKRNSTLILNLVPCYRKADSVVGMYDLVNGTFYTNNGEGTFIVGSDVNALTIVTTRQTNFVN